MSTLETLKDILTEEFDLERERLQPEAQLATLGVDSLDLLDLMFKIEDRYQLTIRDELPATLVTIDDVVKYIDAELERRGPPRGSGGADLPAT